MVIDKKWLNDLLTYSYTPNLEMLLHLKILHTFVLLIGTFLLYCQTPIYSSINSSSCYYFQISIFYTHRQSPGSSNDSRLTGATVFPVDIIDIVNAGHHPWACSLKTSGFRGRHKCGVTLLSGTGWIKVFLKRIGKKQGSF